MVETKKIKSKNYYFCDDCGFAYLERKWADKCQNWCQKFHACNIEITKHAVEKIR
ncbi:MAG: hypothetical protein AABX13_00300 [Nanoarchaeota archaeon]